MLKTIIEKKLMKKRGSQEKIMNIYLKCWKMQMRRKRNGSLKELLVRGNKGLAVIAMNRMSIPRYDEKTYFRRHLLVYLMQ